MPRAVTSSSERPAGILRLSAPLVLSFWFREAFALVDAAYAAQLPDGDAALAAIALTGPFRFLIIACWVGMSNGLTARLSAALGAREGARIAQLVRATRSLIRVLVAAFVVLAAGIWLATPHLGALEPAVASNFRIYGTVLVGGLAFTSFWSILPDSLVKAHHDMRSTMWAGILAGVTNVVLNTLFVFAFGWGIFGIAFATVLARVASLVYAQRRAAHHERRRLAGARDDRPGTFERPVAAIMTIGVPSALSFVMLSLEGLAVNGMLAAAPDSKAALASWAIFDQAVRFMSMPLIAVGVAMLPLSAHLWGGRRIHAIRHELALALGAGAGYIVLVLTPLAFLVGPWVAAALSESAQTRRFAEIGMRWLPLAVLGLSPLFVLRATFDGMQRPRPGLIVSVVRALVLVTPMVYFGLRLAPAAGYPAVAGAFAGYATGAALASLALGLWVRRDLALEAQLQPRTDPTEAG